MKDDLLKKLLNVVATLQEQQVATNEDYNIFYALRIWSKEVTLHSRFIVDLLNPKGYHAKGSLFLKLFLEQFELKGDFDPDNTVEVVDEKGLDNNRRIDIFLKDIKGNVIVIENKIYACDQDMQLSDYYDFGLQQSGSAEKLSVLYLTLLGTEPSAASLGVPKNRKYSCISYSKHIILWIKECIENSTDNTQLSEVLKQYLQTLEYLTKNNMKNIQDVLSVLGSQDDISNLIALSNLAQSFQSEFPKKVGELLKKELGDKYSSEEKGYMYCKTNLVAQNGHEVWLRISPTSAPWCGFVEWGDGKAQRMSQDVVDKLQGVLPGWESNGTDYWWYLCDDVFKLPLESIKKIMGGESNAEIVAFAEVVKDALDKVNKL